MCRTCSLAFYLACWNVRSSFVFRPLSRDSFLRLFTFRNDEQKIKARFVSALTGLRFSDVQALKWKNIKYDTANGWSLEYTQKKTKNAEKLPIAETAFELLGERKSNTEKVFKGLKYSAYNNSLLQYWIYDAEIKKHITFHCARHTNAMLLLNNGVDIYTVSEMLGHRDLKTTQIYAKVMNETKIKALLKLPKINLNNLT